MTPFIINSRGKGMKKFLTIPKLFLTSVALPIPIGVSRHSVPATKVAENPQLPLGSEKKIGPSPYFYLFAKHPTKCSTLKLTHSTLINVIP